MRGKERKKEAEIKKLHVEIDTLKKEIAQLKGIEEAMQDPYFIHDINYHILLWPKAMEKLTGYTAEEVKIMGYSEIFKVNLHQYYGIKKWSKENEFSEYTIVDVYVKNGNKLTTLISNAGIFDDNENLMGIVEVIRDITMEQTRHMRLEKIQTVLDMFQKT